MKTETGSLLNRLIFLALLIAAILPVSASGGTVADICRWSSGIQKALSAAEVTAMLGDLSGYSRSWALGCLEPRIQTGLTGDDLGRILGSDLDSRHHMICRLKERPRAGLEAREVAATLGDLTGYARIVALGCLEPRIKTGLTGDDLGLILGSDLDSRHIMICTIKDHARAGMSPTELAVALGGVHHYGRVAALRCLGATETADALQNAVILGTCGSSVNQQLWLPEYVCFGLDGGTLPYAACSVLRPIGYLPVYFGEACRGHDSCYSSNGTKKSQCDLSLLSLLNDTCDTTLTGPFRASSRTNCRNLASEYHYQVSRRGCSAFMDAQVRAGNHSPTCD